MTRFACVYTTMGGESPALQKPGAPAGCGTAYLYGGTYRPAEPSPIGSAIHIGVH